MTEGKTKDGVVFNVDERMTNDARFTRKLVRIEKLKNLDINVYGAELLNLINEALDMLLVGGANTEKLMDDLAEKHEGICSHELLLQTLNEILEVVNGKNS